MRSKNDRQHVTDNRNWSGENGLIGVPRCYREVILGRDGAPYHPSTRSRPL